MRQSLNLFWTSDFKQHFSKRQHGSVLPFFNTALNTLIKFTIIMAFKTGVLWDANHKYLSGVAPIFILLGSSLIKR